MLASPVSLAHCSHSSDIHNTLPLRTNYQTDSEQDAFLIHIMLPNVQSLDAESLVYNILGYKLAE